MKNKLFLIALIYLCSHFNGFSQAQITHYRYWFDDDFSIAVTTPLSTPSADVELSRNFNTSNLKPGLHTFRLQFLDEKKRWGSVTSSYFYIRPKLVAYQYWYDKNISAAPIISIEPKDSFDLNLLLNTNRFTDSLHTFNIRFKDNTGVWNTTVSQEICLYRPFTFDYDLQNPNKVYFNNKALSSKAAWNFGDGIKDSINANPVHVFQSIGDYKVCQPTKCLKDSCQLVTIKGLKEVAPNRFANSGYFTLIVNGFGFKLNSQVSLIKQNQVPIKADMFKLINSNSIQANFKLNNITTGLWSLIVVNNNDTLILKDGIQIEPKSNYNPEININGPSTILPFRDFKYTVNVSNKSNFPYYGSLVLIKIPGNVTAAVLDSIKYSSEGSVLTDIPNTRFYTVIDSIKKDSVKFATIIIPNIQPYTTETITLNVKSTTLTILPITAYLGPPLFDSLTLSRRGLGVRGINAACEDENIDDKCKDGLTEVFVAILKEGIPDVPKTKSDACKKLIKGETCLMLEIISTGDKVKIDYGSEAKILGKCLSSKYNSEGVGKQLIKLVEQYTDDIDLILKEMELIEFCDAIDQKLPENYADKLDAIRKKHAELTRNATKEVDTRASRDPNLKVGLKGINDKNAVNNDQTLPFTIYFENAADATAPASEVLILDTLDKTKFDLNSFEFTEFNFGDFSFQLAQKKQSFTQDFNLRPKKNIILRVTGNLDTVSGVVSWKYSSFDPSVMSLTQDITQGFLPPNKTKPEGEGYVGYRINLKPNLPHLTEIKNKADIIFDTNTPITTPIWLHTMDKESPKSKIFSVSKKIVDTVALVMVKWSGTDEQAGIKDYALYVSENNGSFRPWLLNEKQDSAIFKGKIGQEYCFYSIARDNVGNVEVKTNNPRELCLKTTATQDNIFAEKAWLGQNKPNPFDNTTTIDFHLNQAAQKVRLDILNLNGSIVKTLLDKPMPFGSHSVEFKDDSLSSGIYFYRLNVDGYFASKKMMIIKP